MDEKVRDTRRRRAAFSDTELDHLRALASRYPSIDAAAARAAELRSRLALPKGAIHVFSDVHGEIKKLRHVINNASGRLAPLVERLFRHRLDAEAKRNLLNLIYYPAETMERLGPAAAQEDEVAAFTRRILELQLEVFRELGKSRTLKDMWRVMPEAWQEILWELLLAAPIGRDVAFVDAIYASIAASRKGLELVRLMSRAIRNLSVDEIVVAGDLGDRGPRIDKVIDYLMRQPAVAIVWGNHDVSWMGACLGNEALIATVVRIALRYHQIAQLEEGYGIPLAPLEELARKVYGDDPAARFLPKEKHLEDPLLIARMQKAIAILQFKLEAQITRRNPHYGMEHRNLLRAVDPLHGTVILDGVTHDLLDTKFPTLDPARPDELTPDEQTCIEALRRSFLESRTLWEHMTYLFKKGSMHLVRDRHLIFHGALPVDDTGTFLSFPVDGTAYAGKSLFDALESSVQRAFRGRAQSDIDLLWYLWSGPVSPLFGKDRMTTFERYFIADKASHKETKNAYFKKIHDKVFCETVLAEFGVPLERALIVNGHVPVKLDEGESPVKKSGIAVTIDGAFSESYGDKGYTLVLEADRTYIAQHHHFASVDSAVTEGADIVPTIGDVIIYDTPRTVADTDLGERFRREIDALERLITAYEENEIEES